MDEGNPVSQPRGEFHGRSERFSDSVVAQPVKTNAALASSASNSRKRRISFISIRRDNQISFAHRSHLPAGHNIRDAALGLHAGDFDLCHQFAVVADD